MKQPVEGMRRFCGFAPVGGSLIYMERKSRHRFGKDTDASVDRRGLHRRPLIDRLTAGCATEEKIPATTDTVFRLIP